MKQEIQLIIKNQKLYLIYLLFIPFFNILPYTAVGEYYQYINKDGVRCFTDDKGNVPENNIKQVVTHKERYDGLDEEEKERMISREKYDIEQIRIKQQEELQHYDMLNRIQQIKEAEIAKKKRLEKMKTAVQITNNRIFVPVTLGYSDRTVTTTLLLDTGASTTLIYNSVAQQLKITGGKRGIGIVANGSKIKTKTVDLQFIQVGHKKVVAPSVTICEYIGPQRESKGLLGLDFLKKFKYIIDYENQYIKWTE